MIFHRPKKKCVTPTIGDTRTYNIFALWPTRVDSKTIVWLQDFYIREIYRPRVTHPLGIGYWVEVERWL